MSADNAILLAICIPLLTAVGIQITGRINDNLREAVTLSGAASLAWVVWGMLPALFEASLVYNYANDNFKSLVIVLVLLK